MSGPYTVPAVHSVRQGATGAYLDLYLRAPGDEPVDLTDAASVTLTLHDERGNVVALDRPLTVLSATQGHVLYVYMADELSQRRRLLGLVRVRRGSSGGGEWGWSGSWQAGWDGLSGGASHLNITTVPSVGSLVVDVR